MVKNDHPSHMTDCTGGWSDVTIPAVATTKGRLRAVTDALGVTSNELARRLAQEGDWDGPTEVDEVRRQVTRWDKGNLPGADRLILIARCLHITVGQLVGTEPLPDPLDYAVTASEAALTLGGDSPQPDPESPRPARGQGRGGRSRKASS